jgi:outer membrane immunogenic protein
MKKLLGALAIAALAAPIGTALAADLRLPVKAPVMAPVAVYNWTGFYIGGNVGYSWGRNEADIVGASTTTTRTRDFRTAGPTLIADTTVVTGPIGFAGTGSTKVDGIIGGGQIGYNWQFDRSWLFGLEADIQGSGEKGDFAVCAGLVGCTVVGTANYKLNWFGTVRGRLGVLASDRVLLYVTGGLAYGELESNYALGFVGFPTAGFGSKQIKAGYTVGGGIEGALGGNWTAKAEYLFMDLGSYGGGTGAFASATSVDLANTPSQGFNRVIDTTTTGTATVSNRFRDNIFRVGLNYRFVPEAVVARY